MDESPVDGFADKMFEYHRAESNFLSVLSEAGFASFEDIGGDFYDCSIEFYKADNDARMNEAAQRVVFDAGFMKAYVNHEDGWETHYSWDLSKPFAPARGWRRRRTEKGYEISFLPEGWKSGKEWVASGYMTIVPDPLEEKRG